MWCLPSGELKNVQVDNSALEQTRMDRGRTTEKMTREESLLEVGLSSTIASLLTQCSEPIFDVALAKLHSFVGGRAFETNVSGRFAAHIVSSVTKFNAGKVLRTFLPHLFRSLDDALLSDEILEEETLQDELLFNLHLLSELVIEPRRHRLLLRMILNGCVSLIRCDVLELFSFLTPIS